MKRLDSTSHLLKGRWAACQLSPGQHALRRHRWRHSTALFLRHYLWRSRCWNSWSRWGVIDHLLRRNPWSRWDERRDHSSRYLHGDQTYPSLQREGPSWRRCESGPSNHVLQSTDHHHRQLSAELEWMTQSSCKRKQDGHLWRWVIRWIRAVTNVTRRTSGRYLDHNHLIPGRRDRRATRTTSTTHKYEGTTQQDSKLDFTGLWTSSLVKISHSMTSISPRVWVQKAHSQAAKPQGEEDHGIELHPKSRRRHQMESLKTSRAWTLRKIEDSATPVR